MAASITARTEPVLLSTRQQLGRALATARELARLRRADLAAALGVDEQRIADFESGSIPIARGT